MDSEQCISWIFLSIASASQSSPADFREISIVADGINHAIPTHKELQTSIAWLTKYKLILQHGKKYDLSEKGKTIFAQASESNTTYFKIWEKLEKKFKEYA